MDGRHPHAKGVFLGEAWPPPMSIASCIVGKVLKATPDDVGCAHVLDASAPGPGSAAGSSAYRASVLKAMGLDEAELATLLAARMAEKQARPAAWVSTLRVFD